MCLDQENQRKYEEKMQTPHIQGQESNPVPPVSSRFYLLYVSALPQLDLSVCKAQLPQAGQLLLPVLQGLELREASHSSCLLPKRLIERRRGKALLLGYTSVGQNLDQNEINTKLCLHHAGLTALLKAAADTFKVAWLKWCF